ncbi:hypothetical protein N665_0018s0004 [Sinapis alba]|nr:hypothetical protein N665_0018s0004 [Sinapis alba]
MYGLKPELRSPVAESNFYTLSELVEKTVNVDIIVEAERKTTLYFGENTKLNQGEKHNYCKGQIFNKGKRKTCGGQVSYSGNSGECYSCGQLGHLSKYCPNKQQSHRQGFSSSGRNDVTCLSCGKKGHFASAVNKSIHVTPLVIQPLPSHPVIEPAPKKKNLEGRVFALGVEYHDSAGPSKGLITCTLGV